MNRINIVEIFYSFVHESLVLEMWLYYKCVMLLEANIAKREKKSAGEISLKIIAEVNSLDLRLSIELR